MPTELEELVEFLHAPQAPIRTVALEHLVGYSQGPQSVIFHHDNHRPIKDLKILARDKGKLIVQQSLTILANLCDDGHIRDLIATDDAFLKYLISMILDLENRNADLATIVLTNLGKHDSIKRIVNWEVEPTDKDVFKSKKAIDCLLDVFVKGAKRSLNKNCDYDYLAFFFADFSRFLEGRKYFVTEQEYDGVVPISKLLPFTEQYDMKTRREGVASTIKNSLFEIEAHNQLLKEDGVNVLPYLLLPIATSKDADLDEEELFELPDELQLLPENKERDPVPEIMCVHLESLLLLCSTKAARVYLRTKSVYPLIRELHKNIDHEGVQELCDRLVQMLMRDENPYEEKVEDVLIKRDLDDLTQNGIKEIKMKEENYESDGDDQIVEII